MCNHRLVWWYVEVETLFVTTCSSPLDVANWHPSVSTDLSPRRRLTNPDILRERERERERTSSPWQPHSLELLVCFRAAQSVRSEMPSGRDYRFLFLLLRLWRHRRFFFPLPLCTLFSIFSPLDQIWILSVERGRFLRRRGDRPPLLRYCHNNIIIAVGVFRVVVMRPLLLLLLLLFLLLHEQQLLLEMVLWQVLFTSSRVPYTVPSGSGCRWWMARSIILTIICWDSRYTPQF